MGLDDPNVIDAVGIEQGTGSVVLTIADSWDWAQSTEHMLALQEKLNRYLDFIESGELVEAYPEGAGRPVVIDIIGRVRIPDAALSFVGKAKSVASAIGVRVRTQLYEGHSGHFDQGAG